jgi:hypothetical protein
MTVLGVGSFHGFEDAIKQRARQYHCVANSEVTLLVLPMGEFYRRITNKETWTIIHSYIASKESFTKFRKK